MSLLDPLRFRPRSLNKVWGGRRLDGFVPGGLGVEGPVGEVWTVADRDEMSSEVDGGELDGRRLTGLMMSERQDLLGAARPSATDRFPVLVKYLDAVEPLSVQVHPDAACAAKLGGEPKDECWYVLTAEPDAHVFLGLADGVDAATFAAEATTGIKVLNFRQGGVSNEAGKDLGSSWCPPQCSRRTVLGGFFTS